MSDDGKMVKPMIDVTLAYGRKAMDCVALIDTGTDLLFVDERILQGLGCPLTDTVVDVTTVHDQVEHNQYLIDMVFHAASASATVDVVAAKLNDRAYHAIFGIRFLDLGVLHLNFKGESYFEFHSGSLAAPD